MKQNINLYQFRDAFRDMDRNNHFSYQGLEVLYDALEDIADDTGQDVDLDVIALCCDFVEYDYKDICDEYSDIAGRVVSDHYDMAVDKLDRPIVSDTIWNTFLREIINEHDPDFQTSVLEALQDYTWVCGTTDNTVVFQAF